MEAPKEIYIQPDAQDRWFDFPNTLPNCTKYIRADLAELTWEDMREIYLIFTTLDVEIESKTTNIGKETIGYCKEALKRFNELKKK